MPSPRNAPTRAAQRRGSHQDDTPTRTRGRGAKPAPSKSDTSDMVASKSSPTKLSPTITRKTTRSASNISGNSFEAAPEIYASYEHPLFMVFGLSAEFFNGLKKHHGKLPKERKSIVGSLLDPLPSSDEDGSESEEESTEESEIEMPIAPQPAPRGRGRGGRGSRGGRGRGGRGRGRGGRGRGGIAKSTSYTTSRTARSAGSVYPTEDGDGQPSNQSTPNHGAKPPSRGFSGTDSDDDNEEAIEDDSADEFENMPMPKYRGAQRLCESINGASELSRSNKTSVPKIALLPESASQTPRDSASTPAESAVPKLLAPEEDVLSESDLPDPFIEDAPSPTEAECEDRADYLLHKRFKPLSDVQAAIAALTKFPAGQRSTENLYILAENAQHILKAWQDEYLTLDARTAPHMHPAKKACNGGRIPLAQEIFEDMKEADLYGYTYDPKKPPGCQDPWAQRPGAEKGGRRELRTRRNRDMLESAAPSEEEGEENDIEGRPSKRQRKATRKFDGTDTGTGANTPKKHNGWGGARKKGVSRFAKPNSETPEPEGRTTKRARTAASNLLHQRIQEMREESLVGSSGDEESSTIDVDDYTEGVRKRGRPAGSKNVARRSDYGIKKGPRKKTSEAGTPTPSAHGPHPPPVALNSMSEGQGQFTVAQPFTEGIPLMPQHSAENVFQSTPQYSAPTQEAPLTHPSESSTPDAYMLTAPLSQYTNNYVDESSPNPGSRRKPRVKSEKRSQSMTMWWAERKAKKREQDEKEGKPAKPTSSRSNSVSRRGGRQSGGSATGQTPQPQSQNSESQQASPIHHAQHAPLQHSPRHAPPESYLQYTPAPPTGPPQHYMYASGPPPPHHMMVQYSPLAALPTGSYPSPFTHHNAPPHPQSGIPLFQPPNSAGGAFGGAPRQLAPAPMGMPTYPSPYGPQSPAGGRPKSSGQGLPKTATNGQQVLAPAPPQPQQPQQAPPPPGQQQHFSPYAPATLGREMPFKVMVPGPAPERRGSR